MVALGTTKQPLPGFTGRAAAPREHGEMGYNVDLAAAMPPVSVFLLVFQSIYMLLHWCILQLGPSAMLETCACAGDTFLQAPQKATQAACVQNKCSAGSGNFVNRHEEGAIRYMPSVCAVLLIMALLHWAAWRDGLQRGAGCCHAPGECVICLALPHY